MKFLNVTLLASSLLFGINSYAGNITYNNMTITPETTTAEFLLDANENIRKIYKKTPNFFKTSQRVKADIEMEDILIEGFKKNVFPRSEYMDKNDFDNMMSDYFVNALNSGHSRLADEILFNSGATIDVNFLSDSPKKNPLAAVATYNGYDGGDIEYFVKLVNMGANHSYLTEKNKVSLMGLAAAMDNYKIVLYLAMLGENPMHLDGFEYYPLDYASKNNSNRTIIVLTNIIEEYKKQIEARNASN